MWSVPVIVCNFSFLDGFNSRQLLSTNSTKYNCWFPPGYGHSFQWGKAESVCGYSIKDHNSNDHFHCSYYFSKQCKLTPKTNSDPGLATFKFGGYIKDTFLTLAMLLPLPVWYAKSSHATVMTTGYFQETWSLSATGPWHTHSPAGSKNLAPSLCLSFPVLLLTALPWLLYWWSGL